jgi:dTDP-3-amino-3,4,6-trideoxy-alpha-D-glucose transaminase
MGRPGAGRSGGLTAVASARAASVPFADLRRDHAPIVDELRAAFDGVLASSGFVLGEEVERFEQEFAALCGVNHCVGVASGTAALRLALLAAGLRAGDEVIVPAHTYISTALAVVHAGAVPVFCDVDEVTGLIDVAAARALVGHRTAAVLPVHLYGQVCDMHSLRGLARDQSLLLLEDAAQAHGARWQDRRAGSLGRAAAFSFYPSKNLGALGDGGAICTNDPELAACVRRLRNLGQACKGQHEEAGFNERLDGLQAALLRVKLRRLEDANRARRRSAALYRRLLPADIRPLRADPRCECVYHLFPVRVPSRDAFRDELAARGVETRVHYSPCLPHQPPFAGTSAASVPRAEAWAAEEVSLPLFPAMTSDEVRRVARAAEAALEAVA